MKCEERKGGQQEHRAGIRLEQEKKECRKERRQRARVPESKNDMDEKTESKKKTRRKSKEERKKKQREERLKQTEGRRGIYQGKKCVEKKKKKHMVTIKERVKRKKEKRREMQDATVRRETKNGERKHKKSGLLL